jgi:hypothetical protein
MHRVFGAACAVALVVVASPAAAQSLNQLLTGLTVTGARQHPGGRDFETTPAGAATAADIASGIGSWLPRFPTAPFWGTIESGGPADGGNLVLTAGSFGERAATGGRGRFRMGLVHQGTEYGSLDGFNLRRNDMKLVLAHSAAPHTSPPDADALEQFVSMDLDRRTTALFAAFGLSDRLDVGILVPAVHVNVNARVTSFIRRAAGSDEDIHSFDPLYLANRTEYGDWTANGIGDLELRAKLRASRNVALTAGVRAPTGDEDDWIGLGAWQMTGGVIVSGTAGRVGPRLNAGYTFSRESSNGIDVADEINYGAGVDIALSRYVTLSADAVGRSLLDVARLHSGSLTLPPATTTAGFTSTAVLLASTDRSTLHTAFGSGGVRVLAGRHLLLSSDVYFPILDKGLAPKIGVVFGANVLF